MKKILFFLYFQIILLFLNAKEVFPYKISNEIFLDFFSDEKVNIELRFTNNSSKEIEKIDITFFLFDSFGEPLNYNDDKISITICKKILPFEDSNISFSIPKNDSIEEVDSFFIDYFFVNKIYYSDGTSWDDMFGQKLYHYESLNVT